MGTATSRDPRSVAKGYRERRDGMSRPPIRASAVSGNVMSKRSVLVGPPSRSGRTLACGWVVQPGTGEPLGRHSHTAVGLEGRRRALDAPFPRANGGPMLHAVAAEQVIAVDIDDTLNDFTATLRTTPFPYDPKFALPEATFAAYLPRVRYEEPEPGDRLSTEYSLFRYKIHEECYRRAAARADGVAFMQWLKARDWRIVICTHRDLRRAHDCTRTWLNDHRIPFDYLFTAFNKIAFCRAWNIAYLVDDDANSVAYGPSYGVRVFHRIADHDAGPSASGGGFRSFDEVKPWIEE